jgi:glycosyltransferase involved in cell wall biosynthesis
MLHIVAPVYNEADNVVSFVEAIERAIPKPFTLWIVYDFDEDTTLPPARKLAKTRPWLKLLRNELGRGVVNALRAGFNAARQDFVLRMPRPRRQRYPGAGHRAALRRRPHCPL